MSEVLDGVRIKIDRAVEHLEAAQAEIARVVGPDTYRTVTEHNAERTEYVCRIEGLHPIDNRLGAIVGDFLYNLRSALDHIAYALIRAAGIEPTTSTLFPILTTRPARPIYISPSPGPGTKVMEMVEDVQPYAHGDGTAHPLAFLDELNRIDKHRQLLFAIAVVGRGAWGMPPDMPSPRARFWPRANDAPVDDWPHPLKDGDVVARFTFERPWPPYPEPDFDPEFALKIRLDDRAGFDLRIARHALEDLMESILWNVRDWIVPKFEPSLA